MIKYLFLPFHNVIKKNKRSRLRQIMRGRCKLKKAGQLGRINLVKQALTEQPLKLTQKHFSSYLMGVGAESSGEIIVRQYLLTRLAHKAGRLHCDLLLALGEEHGKVVSPIPHEWREVLEQHNFDVAHFRSALLWQLYVCAIQFYGVVMIAKIVFDGITSVKNTVHNQKRYVYFAGLDRGNTPQIINGNHNYDVVSWYLQWTGRTPNIEAIQHSAANSSPLRVGNVVVAPQRRALPALIGWKSIIKYAVWGACASIISVLDCLRGRWWHAFLLNQGALAAQVRYLPVDALAREYLFHNSEWIYRPLWTYDAEYRGSKITFYFYSTNCEEYKKPDGYSPLTYGWKIMSWSCYLVWDEYQFDFVRRAVGEQASISVVGPIWFHGGAVEMSRLNKRAVAVFDVTPRRNSRYSLTGESTEFHVPAVINPFLEHVCNAVRKHDFVMLLKGKRNVGDMVHPQYRSLLNQLTDNSNVVLIDPDASAYHVVESSIAVISMPFTSTALIAREMGKPSIYYDPLALLQQDDRAAHGIPIISGVDELEAWLSAQLVI